MWGHVNIIGQGAVKAVLQMDVQYGVDWQEMKDRPAMPYFDLHVDERYSYFRNKSHITVKACVRYYIAPVQINMTSPLMKLYLSNE